jgi:branched-subunit amino acid transport protein
MRAQPILLYVLASALASYLPRLIPFLIRGLDRLPEKVALFLKIMPVAALGALIFPGVILDFLPVPAAGIFGIATAALLAYLKGGLILPILASIAAAAFYLQLFG